MTYASNHRPRDKAATITLVGALHVAAAIVIVKGLSFAGLPRFDPPPLQTTNTPLPVPAPPPHRPVITHHDAPRPQFTPMPFDPPTLNPPSFPTDGGTTSALPFKPIPPVEPTRPAFVPRAAQPLGNPARWVTPDDYPGSDLRMDHAGAVGFTLAVSAEGRVTGCTVTRSSTFPGLDNATCAILTRRARFRPATGDEGQPVAGTFSSTVRWKIPQ